MRKEDKKPRSNLEAEPPATQQVPMEPDQSSDSEYWEALGQFMDAFMRAENQLFMYLIHLARIDKAIGKVIFRESRQHPLSDFVRKIWEIQEQPAEKYQELDDVLTRLSHINQQRNLAVHSISHVYEDIGRVRTKRLRAPTEEQVDEAQMSPTYLRDMSRDLARIKDHLFTAWYHPEEPLEKRRHSYQALRQPWRCRWPPNAPTSSQLRAQLED